jgi:hypothetical protein
LMILPPQEQTERSTDRPEPIGGRLSSTDDNAGRSTTKGTIMHSPAHKNGKTPLIDKSWSVSLKPWSLIWRNCLLCSGLPASNCRLLSRLDPTRGPGIHLDLAMSLRRRWYENLRRWDGRGVPGRPRFLRWAAVVIMDALIAISYQCAPVALITECVIFWIVMCRGIVLPDLVLSWEIPNGAH